MATNTLIIKDGNGTLSALSANSASTGLIPEHTISGTVDITASVDNPVAVYVQNSLNVSASQENPVYVTGSVSTVANVNVNDGLKVELSGSNVKLLSGSSTNTYLQVHLAPVATGSAKNRVSWSDPSPGAGLYFDWDSAQSGSVLVASSSVDRKALIVFNPSAADIYVSLGQQGYPETNGFSLFSTASAPNFYSFILYASGTYFADPQNVGVAHALYAISSSEASSNRDIMITEIY
jgi:hypothetical protein